MEVLTKGNIHNTLIIVTRYFGGTLLGTGGLVRAYGQSSKAAIENSRLLRVCEGVSFSVECDYNSIGKIKYIIAHNEKMKEYLEEIGLNANIYTLDLFDYICDKKENYTRKNNTIEPNSLKVAYAGNLIKVKSPYLYQLDKDKMNFYINLYGVGIENNINERLIYNGKYPPNELPDKIEANLGLIWDGNFDDSDENVGYKKYTKYNNPHKLSCYIAAGLPVIVWKKAAIADFVNKYNIGYTINKIYDINEIDLSDYNQKLANISKLQQEVRNGEFTIRVFDKVLKDMEENNK